jgi:hypothetical protein
VRKSPAGILLVKLCVPCLHICIYTYISLLIRTVLLESAGVWPGTEFISPNGVA